MFITSSAFSCLFYLFCCQNNDLNQSVSVLSKSPLALLSCCSKIAPSCSLQRTNPELSLHSSAWLVFKDATAQGSQYYSVIRSHPGRDQMDCQRLGAEGVLQGRPPLQDNLLASSFCLQPATCSSSPLAG